MPNMVSLIANAPHPEEGRKLIDYLLSADVERQLAQSEAVQIPLHAGVPGPKNIPAIDTFKPMTLDYAKAASSRRGRDEPPGGDSGPLSHVSGNASRHVAMASRSRTVVIGVAIAAFVVCCVLPVAYLLAISLSCGERRVLSRRARCAAAGLAV